MIWFGAPKVDHPLADAKASRRIIEEFPNDTFKAMAEIAYWLDSVNATAGFRLDRRFELLDQLERAAKPHLRRLANDYLAVRQQQFQEHRAWTALTGFRRLTSAGYLLCIEGLQADAAGASGIRVRAALIAARALHASAQLLKWTLLRYGPVDAALWTSMGRAYAFAEASGVASQTTSLYATQEPSSPQRELLRSLMLAAASAESLLPKQIDLAERSIAVFASHFALAASPQPGCTHAFDLAAGKVPARARQQETQGRAMRYFGAGSALGQIERLLGVLLAEGALPSDVALGVDAEPKAIEAVWRHLLQYWGPVAPARRSERRRSSVRLTVVPGLPALMQELQGGSDDSLDFSSPTRTASSESWVVENASDGGYGAVVPEARGDWLQIGALVGLKPEGEARWSVGVVRRMLSESDGNRRVGIELLARVAVPVRLAPTGTISPFNAVREDDPAVLLTPKPDAERRVRLLLPAGLYTPQQALEMRVHGHAYALEPEQSLDASSSEFDLGVFRLVRRIA